MTWHERFKIKSKIIIKNIIIYREEELIFSKNFIYFSFTLLNYMYIDFVVSICFSITKTLLLKL